MGLAADSEAERIVNIIEKRPTAPDGSKLERRKSQRFEVPLRIKAEWESTDGKAFKESAVASQVNIQGGLLRMSTCPEIGRRITLTNVFTSETAGARVLAAPRATKGGSQGIAVELIVPSETFWGASLQVKKAELELAKLEKYLVCAGANLGLLREYRDAVDCLRSAAQAAQELRARQVDGHGDEGATPWLASARVRRTRNLSLELIADLDAGRVSSETQGVEELRLALEQASSRLKNRLNRKAPRGFRERGRTSNEADAFAPQAKA